MKKIFKRITDINYNGKIFTIFVDENHRFTFLERNKAGKFFYPKFDDYIALNDIYNKKNLFIFNSVKKYRFVEKVNLGIVIASVIVNLTSLGLSTASIISMIANDSETIEETNEVPKEINNADYLSSYQNWNVNVVNEQVEVINQVPDLEYHAIESLDELDNILGFTSVTIEDINEALENNNKLDSYYKQIAYNLAVSIYKNNPEADLRIFYYHLKDLESVSMTQEEYKKKFKDYSVGRYNSNKNKFYYVIGCDEEILYHEIAHSINSFWIEIDSQIYCSNNLSTSAINEVFTNKIVNYVMPTTSYQEETKVVDYLLTFTDFDFNRYNEEGASYILYDIHKLYPNVDIFYINDYLEVMMDNVLCLNEYTYIEDSSEILDELFCLCKARINANREEGYRPFLDFANLITTNEEVFNKYFNEYNEYLESLQLDVISEEYFDIYKNINGFILKDDMLYPYINNIENGDATIIVGSEYQKKSIRINGISFPINHLILNIKKELLSNPNIQIDSEFWKKFLIKYDYLNRIFLYKTKVMLNGNTLVDDYLGYYRIQIGLTSQNKIGFIISNSNDEIIYESEENLQNKSQKKWLTSYYSINYDNVNELELIDILNEEYLLMIQNKDNLFSNLIIDDNKFILEPSYFMYVKNRNGATYSLELNNCLITNSEEDSFQISGHTISINMDFPDEPIYLKDILNYYGILDEDTLEYHFTEEEIRELVTNYLEEMKNNKTRPKRRY